MQTRDFLVQMLGQDIDLVFDFTGVFPQFDLRQHWLLVNEACADMPNEVTRGISRFKQGALRERQDPQTIAEGISIHVGPVSV